MDRLRKTAEQGRYLKPFAKIFLALAAMRERQEGLARKQFSDLVAEFPDNPLFALDLARLKRQIQEAGIPGSCATISAGALREAGGDVNLEVGGCQR